MKETYNTGFIKPEKQWLRTRPDEAGSGAEDIRVLKDFRENREIGKIIWTATLRIKPNSWRTSRSKAGLRIIPFLTLFRVVTQ